MSSVTRFLRQIPTGLAFYGLPSNGNNLYEFVPTTANYVGNYTPGAMVAAGAGAPTLLAYLTSPNMPYASGIASAPASGFIMRDMGKTIKASVATSEANAAALTTASNSEGYFRQFQILKPIAGNTDGAFGVQGAATVPNGYTDYLTVYVPITVTGASYVTPAGVYPLAGGQM
jgi:hypothetical protein